MRTILRKIIVKTLLCPAVRRLATAIVRCYDAFAVEDAWHTANAKRRTRLDFSHYLPGTEERIGRLRRIVNGRTVAIILHGPSLAELEERITELKDCDICYFGLNYFWVTEKNILAKINRTFSAVICPTLSIQKAKENSDFLERPEENIFIYNRESFDAQGLDLGQFIEKYDEKLLFYTVISSSMINFVGFGSKRTSSGLFLEYPSAARPLHFPRQNTLGALLPLAVISGAPRIVIFGGDGGRIGSPKAHFRETGGKVPDDAAAQNIMDDTLVLNASMPAILERVRQIYNLPPVEIINCSAMSYYTPFPKLSYEDTFAWLKSSGKNTAKRHNP